MKEKKLQEKLIELGYMQNIFEDTLWNKKYNDYCIFHIELETDEEYKKERLIHTAYIESVFIIHEQRIIDELEKGFKILQFNAVVATNVHARHLYERIGFKQLGIIPSGFRMKAGHYEDICPYYYEL